jgi:hypothetical protein
MKPLSSTYSIGPNLKELYLWASAPPTVWEVKDGLLSLPREKFNACFA